MRRLREPYWSLMQSIDSRFLAVGRPEDDDDALRVLAFELAQRDAPPGWYQVTLRLEKPFYEFVFTYDHRPAGAELYERTQEGRRV